MLTSGIRPVAGAGAGSLVSSINNIHGLSMV